MKPLLRSICVHVLLFCAGYGIGTFVFNTWLHTDESSTCTITERE